MSITGKTVLLTRPREQSADLADRLERLGASVTVVPLIEIQPPDSWQACDRVLDRITAYDAILLTSANAARAFFRRAAGRGVALAGAAVVAIGEATRAAAVESGVQPAPGEAYNSARELARHLLASPVSGRRYLFPCGDIARDELPALLRAAGAEVERVEVYRTLAPAADSVAPARSLLEHGGVDLLVFASPSAVRNFRELLGEPIRGGVRTPAVAVIGTTTEAEARRCGWTPAVVAGQPTASALVTAIQQYFS